jgi:hypothetical protein
MGSFGQVQDCRTYKGEPSWSSSTICHHPCDTAFQQSNSVLRPEQFSQDLMSLARALKVKQAECAHKPRPLSDMSEPCQ